MHNFIQCRNDLCIKQDKCYPFSIKDAVIVETKKDYNKSFIINILEKIDWSVFIFSLESLNINCSFYKQKPELNDFLLEELHSLLLERNITEGKLVCDFCKKEYPIVEGIPNMLL